MKEKLTSRKVGYGYSRTVGFEMLGLLSQSIYAQRWLMWAEKEDFEGRAFSKNSQAVKNDDRE